MCDSHNNGNFNQFDHDWYRYQRKTKREKLNQFLMFLAMVLAAPFIIWGGLWLFIMLVTHEQMDWITWR